MIAGARLPVSSCSACREVTDRSNLYERWLMAENHADGATLKFVAEARGFCSQHARRLLERDPDIAAPMAHFVLRVVATQMERQQRHGYRDALEPKERCPWCIIEAEALSSALMDATRVRSLCPPHQRALRMLDQDVPAEPPLTVFEPLSPATTMSVQRRSEPWWSPQVEELAVSLLKSCPACVAAREAGHDREAFLRRGPVPNEHWDTPTLCAAHYAALNCPLTSEYQQTVDSVWRPCDWCLPIQRAAQSITTLFSIAYREAEFRLAYAHGSGLCLPHAATVLRHLNVARQEFIIATRVRIDTVIWELDERASRRSWQLRDQAMLPHAADLPYRAWWLIAGGTFRYEAERQS